MAINGTVQATGEFAPTATGDTYAIIDAKYMRDGLRNVDLIADLDNITEDRRIAGMLVGVSGGTTYYKLNSSPWAYNFTDWTVFTTGGGGGVDYWTSGSTGLNSIKTTSGGSDSNGISSIAGGANNFAVADYSLSIGGYGNSNSGVRSATIGGFSNTIMTGRTDSIIGGGQNNTISGGTHSVIIGGYNNVNSGTRSSIIGGGYGVISSHYSQIIGGRYNRINGYGNYGTLIGGAYNEIFGDFLVPSYYSAIIGGNNNYVNAQGSVVIGGSNISGLTADTVYVPSLNINSALINDNSLTQVLVRATDGTIKYKDTSSFSFTGNTSGTCITSLYVTDIYGCSPVTIHGSTTGSGNSSFKVRNATTELVSVRDDGYTEIAKNGAQVLLGNASNYLDYYQNRVIQFSNTATYTGFHANRNGSGVSMRATGANDISLIESTGTMTFSTNWDNNFNNGGTLAMLINGNSQDVGIGLPTNLTLPSARLHVRSTGTTSASAVQVWQNGTPTEIARVTDDGGLVVGINTLTGGFANAARLRVDATVTADYTNTVVFDQTYNNASNNGNSPATLNTRIYKSTTGSTNDMKAASFQARNDGTGGISYLYGTESMIWNIGSATINSAFAISARAQIQSGTITNYGGLDVSFQELAGTTSITNMYGVFVRTPVNVSATGTPVTNSYGILIQSNTYGVNNYGVYQDGPEIKNYFGGKVGFNITAPTALTHIKATGDTTGNVFRVDSTTADNLLTIQNNGHIGINSAPSAADRVYIAAGSGKDGALNISAPNVNNGGYGILVQGSGAGASMYGIWADITGGSSDGFAFRGSALASGVVNNRGGYFNARNGTTQSIGVYAQVSGGDSVNSTESAAVYATNGSTQSTDRKGFWTLVTGSVSGGTSYGVKTEVDASGANAINYGLHALINGNNSGATNYAAWLQADGGSNATNYALVTNGGNSGFGATAPTDTLHVNGVTGSTQFRLEKSYTPSGSGDTAGNIGSIAWDDNYIYTKTNTGWGRAALSYAF